MSLRVGSVPVILICGMWRAGTDEQASGANIARTIKVNNLDG